MTCRFVLGTLVGISLAILYLVYLNHGCELTGYMTWHGKECLEI